MAGSDSDHIIQKLIFEVDIDSRDKVHRTHEEFSRLFREAIVPILEKVLDQYDVPGHLIRIDKLELDLGSLDFNSIDYDLKSNLERNLKHLLDDTIPKILGDAAASPDSKDTIIPLTASHMEAMEHFLIHGRFPTRYILGGKNPESILRDLAEDMPRELGQALRKASRRSPQVASRLVRQFSPSVYPLVFEILFPNQKTYLETVEAQFEVISRQLELNLRSGFRLSWREIIFDYVLTKEGAFNKNDFVKKVREDLSVDWELPKGEFWTKPEEAASRIELGGAIKAQEAELEEFKIWLTEGKAGGARAGEDWYKVAQNLYRQTPDKFREVFKTAFREESSVKRWMRTLPPASITESLRFFAPRYYKKVQLWYEELKDVYVASADSSLDLKSFEEKVYRIVARFGVQQKTGWEPERLGKAIKAELRKQSGIPQGVLKEVDRLVKVEKSDASGEFTPSELRYQSVYDTESVEESEPSLVRQLENIIREGPERLRRWVRQNRDPEKFAEVIAEIPAATLKRMIERMAPSGDRYVRQVMTSLAKELPEIARKEAPTTEWIKSFYKESLKFLADRNLSYKPEKFEAFIQKETKKWSKPPEKLSAAIESLPDYKKLGEAEPEKEAEKRPWELPSRESRLEAASETVVEDQDLRQAQADLLEFYLREGELPWWSEAQPSLQVESVLENLSNKDPELIRDILVASYESQSGYSGRAEVVQRVLEQVKEEQLTELLETFEPGFAGLMGTVALGLKYYYDSPESESRPGKFQVKEFFSWGPILQYVLEKGDAPVSTDMLSRFVVTRMAAALKTPSQKVVKDLQKISKEAIERGERRFFPLENLLDQWIREGESTELTTEEKKTFSRTVSDIQALDRSLTQVSDAEIAVLIEADVRGTEEEKELLEQIKEELLQGGPEALGFSRQIFDERVQSEIPPGLSEVEEQVYARMITKRLLQDAVETRSKELFEVRVLELRAKREARIEQAIQAAVQREAEISQTQAKAQLQVDKAGDSSPILPKTEGETEQAQIVPETESPLEVQSQQEATEPDTMVQSPSEQELKTKDTSPLDPPSVEVPDAKKETLPDDPVSPEEKAGTEEQKRSIETPSEPGKEQEKSKESEKEQLPSLQTPEAQEKSLDEPRPEEESTESKEIETADTLSPIIEEDKKAVEAKEPEANPDPGLQEKVLDEEAVRESKEIPATEKIAQSEAEPGKEERTLNEQEELLVPDGKTPLPKADALMQALEPKAQLEVLRRFLNFGSLPPALGAVSRSTFVATMTRLSSAEPKKVSRLLRRNLSKEVVRRRIINNNIPEALQDKWKAILSPNQAGAIKEYAQAMVPLTTAADSQLSKVALAEHSLFYAAYNRESGFSPEGYVRDLLRFLVREEGKDYLKALTWLETAVEKTSFSKKKELKKALELLKKQAGAAPPPQLSSARSYKSLWDSKPAPILDTGEEVYVQNAGIMMIHPFLFTYFDMLEMLDSNRQFKSVEMQNRGVHLLQYLYSREEDAPEQELSLNKLLVGLPLNFPVEYGVNLTEEEKFFTESMLQKAVVDSWTLVKNSSPDGIRVTFFKREGRISFEKEKWFIRIEQKSMDMLLDKWPHGLGLVKLPWLENFIQIEWR